MSYIKYGDAGKTALDTLAEQGFGIPTTFDLDSPQLPPDITELSDEDLMRLFQWINEYTKYIKVQAGFAHIDEADLKKSLEYVESVATATAMSSAVKGTTVTAIKTQVNSEPAVVEAQNAYNVAYGYRKMIDVMVTNLESDMNLVSRELTRRTSGGNFKTRADRFTT